MVKRLITALLFFTAPMFFLPEILRAECQEVSMSTCVGDFANGGDDETGPRLLGNTSGFSLGFLQNNKVRIFMSSGILPSDTAQGYIGIFTDGISQFPKFHLDVWGNLRTTGTLILGTTVPSLNQGVTNYYMMVQNNVFNIQRNGQVAINASSAPTGAQFYVNGPSSATTYYGDGSNLTGITIPAQGITSLNGSTFTKCLNIPSAFISTITAYGIPGAYLPPSPSTITIYSMWASAVAASTVGWTRFDPLISPAFLSSLAPSRFLPLSLSTGSTLGAGGYSGKVTTTVVINAHETFGIGISSLAVSGIVSQGCAVCFRMSETSPTP